MERVESLGAVPKMVDGWYVGDGEFPAHPLERLVYFARLAPSNHNSQPWKFVVGEAEIDVFADPERWLPVADRDRRELFLSLGCAIESLRIAADYAGFGTQVRHFPVPDNETLVARVSVQMNGPKRDEAAASLLKHMLTRHTSHRLFEPSRPVSDAHRLALYNCFQVGEVSLHYLRERPVLDGLASLEERADAELFADPEYRKEVARWLGAGVFGSSWLLSKLGQFAVNQLPIGRRVAHEDGQRLASAPLAAMLTTRGDRRVDQIQAGEAYMHLALTAESLDIRVQPVSQILEVPGLRAELSQVCGLGDRVAQHLFRLGHAAPETARTSRLPLSSIIVRAGRSSSA